MRSTLLLLPELTRKDLALWGSGGNMVEAIRQGSNVGASAVGDGLAAEFAAQEVGDADGECWRFRCNLEGNVMESWIGIDF